MRADWARQSACAAAGAALVMAASMGPAHAGRWTNHIDASMINEIVVRENVLYIATFGGLLVYDTDTGTFDQYRNDAGLPSNALKCLVFDNDGDIYIGTADIGVAKVRLSGGRLTLIRALNEQIDGLASNAINTIALWGDDIVYGSTPGAGTIRNDFASARYFERDGLPAPDVLDVLPFGDRAWMATDGGVVTLNPLGLIEPVAGAPAEANVLGTDGTDVWVGTDTGVRRYAGGSWPDVGPGTQKVYSLAWDGSTMWGGATRNFMRYSGSGQTWTLFATDAIQTLYKYSGGLDSAPMRGLAVLPGAHVYVGNAQPNDLRGPNLMHFDGTNLVNLKANTPGANNVIRLSVDTDGSLWASFFSFYVGKLMPNGAWFNYNSSVTGIELPSNQFANVAFLADSDGIKWFSTLSDPTRPPSAWKPLDELDDRIDAVYSNDTWVRHALDSGGGDGLGSLRPQRAAEDPRGNRWFLSDDGGVSQGWQGIHILGDDKSEWFEMSPATDARMVAANVVDVAFGSDFAFVAFKENGVYRWNHGGYDWSILTDTAADTWQAWVSPGQLPSEADITRLQLRSDGRLWIATTSGLFYREASNPFVFAIPVYAGIGPGIISAEVKDIVLDHDKNLWVATSLGLNRIARDDTNDIRAFMTPAAFAALSGLRYPLDVISPLAHADCRSLAIHPSRDLLYIGTFGGLSVYDFSAPPATATDLSRVYVYPNPVYTSRGHTALKIANLTGPVTVEIYDLEGERVDSRSATQDGDVVWDLSTRSGTSAGSGNYIVRIVGPTGSVQRTVAVIR